MTQEEFEERNKEKIIASYEFNIIHIPQEIDDTRRASTGMDEE
jgi:hypothetical protein